jgi:hypothetical protein
MLFGIGILWTLAHVVDSTFSLEQLDDSILSARSSSSLSTANCKYKHTHTHTHIIITNKTLTQKKSR